MNKLNVVIFKKEGWIMIGQNIQLLNMFSYLWGFSEKHRGLEQTKGLVKAKGHQALCISVP